MSGLELLPRNLAAWSLQAAALALAAAALGRLVPVDSPRARLALGQGLLALLVLLPALQPWRAASASVSASTVLNGATAAAPAAGSQLPGGWPEATLALLAAGAAVQLARLCLRLVRVRAVVREAPPFPAAPALVALRDAVAPSARLLASVDAASPAAAGLRRPAVLLPPAVAAMEPDQQKAIVLHELLHVRRRDWLVQLLEEVLRALLFFHPAVHWLLARVRLAREQCVDAEVVRRMGSRAGYLESLLEVARLVGRSRAVPAAPLIGEGHLRERVDLLLKEVIMSGSRTAVHLGLTAIAVVLSVAWVATAMPMQAPKPAATGATVNLEDKASQGPVPRKVKDVKPVYPADAAKEGAEGLFVIAVVIGKDGVVRDAKLLKSAPTPEKPKESTGAALAGDARLAQAALDAVKQWQYEPVVKDGKPVEAHATVTVAFRLDDKKKATP